MHQLFLLHNKMFAQTTKKQQVGITVKANKRKIDKNVTDKTCSNICNGNESIDD